MEKMLVVQLETWTELDFKDTKFMYVKKVQKEEDIVQIVQEEETIHLIEDTIKEDILIHLHLIEEEVVEVEVEGDIQVLLLHHLKKRDMMIKMINILQKIIILQRSIMIHQINIKNQIILNKLDSKSIWDSFNNFISFWIF